MKFITTKKISQNETIALLVKWMLVLFMVAVALNVGSKIVEFGVTPSAWVLKIGGNADEFVEPMAYNELLFLLHSDLFLLIMLYVLIASLYVRLPHASKTKHSVLLLGVVLILVYSVGLLLASMVGFGAIASAWAAFFALHLLFFINLVELLVAMLKRHI